MNDTRLYRQFQPSHYSLHITMDRKARRFSGAVTIQGTTEGSDHIILHAHQLHITRALVDSQEVTFQHGDNDTLILATPDLPAAQHELIITFDGKITNPMHGLYPCYFKFDGQDEELLATQFESHHAREVFPCIDEPEAKATFDLTLVSEPGITVVSNSPIKEQHEEQDHLVTTFETTPRMSTYLLAWVAGKLDMQEATTKDGVLVRTFATKGKHHQLGYALRAAVAQLEFMNDYYGVPYPLPKCDLVALPDFSAGAMENWGCITFRENLMLVDEHSSTHTRQFATMVIAHELAHQWFGDLVTMRWWNDLWLNESFANWMEYYVPSQLYPQWQLMTQYYDEETTFAIERDSLASVQKIQQDVRTPQEIQALFDPAIVYAKGGSLINMLHDYLGNDAFRKGLRLYFERHKYGNTEAADLWQAWGEASGRDVMSFMLPWITQAGLPVVTTGVSDKTVNLHQRRFFSNPSQAKGNEQSIWPIPLLADGQLDEALLDKPSASLKITSTDKPLLLNQGRTGYYQVMYDEAHTQRLAEEVRSGQLSTIDRMGLLNDNLNLSEAGLQPLVTALKLLESYRDEDNMSVWGVMSSYLNTLKVFAGDDDTQLAQVRSFIRTLAAPQYQRLGWEPVEGEPYFDELLRPLIISHMAYAEDPEATTKLVTLFDQAKQPEDIWSDIRVTVCQTAAYHGDVATFEKLLDWYVHTTSAEQRSQLTAGLCGFRDPVLIQRALALLTTETVKLQDMFYWVARLARNRFARDLTWKWMQANWQWIADQFGNDLHYTSFPQYMAAAFSQPAQLESFKQFFKPLLKEPGIERTIRQGIEDIEARILWLERDGQQVATFLQDKAS